MRNKKLLQLQTTAEQAFGALTAYLHRLDAREEDSNFVHGKMLFDEGWRLRATGDGGNGYLLWMDTDEEGSTISSTSPAQILASLSLNAGDESNFVMLYLIELTEEAGTEKPKAIATAVNGSFPFSQAVNANQDGGVDELDR